MIDDHNIALSFIIPHKGRFEMLIETIQSITSQQSQIHRFEIIVVSQTKEILQCRLSEVHSLPIQIFIRPSEDTISSLRNFGVQHSHGEHLAFLDADVYLSANWIEQMFIELNKRPDRVVISAMQICEKDAPPLEKIRTSLSNAEVDVNVAFLPGRNLFMRKESFNRIGGFPEHLVTCEDYFFTDKAAKIGALFYTSSATYRHIGEDKVYSEMFKKEIWRGQSNIQSLSGRKIPLREWPSFIVPPAILFLLMLTLLCLILKLPNLALISSCLGLLPIFIYTIRLYSIKKDNIQFLHVFWFYLVYFPARAIGTFSGLFKTIKIK